MLKGSSSAMVACFVFDEHPALFAKIKNCIFGPPYGGIRGNISALAERFNAKKLRSRVSANVIFTCKAEK